MPITTEYQMVTGKMTEMTNGEALTRQNHEKVCTWTE